MKKFLAMILVLVCCIGLWGCVENKRYDNDAKMKIYTSFYPMYFLTQQIAGDKADVIAMIPAGAEPHDWEPTPKMVVELQKASMFVYNGAGMETWVDRILDNIDQNKTKIVEASEGIELLKSVEHEGIEEQEEHGHDGDYDPHVWVSPMRAKQQGQNILNALIEIDPSNSEYYEENFDKLGSRMDKLDSDIREASKAFESNVIVVSHEAFGYFARDYGLKQIAIRGINPEDEPSPSQMARLVSECRENEVKYVFFEKLTNPKLSETLAREVGAGTLVLHDAGGLSQEDIEAGKDYISVMYENIENLKKALSE